MSENKSNNRTRKKKYYSNKEMKKMYPDGAFRILGEVSNEPDKHQSDAGQKNTMNIKPLKSYNRLLYKKVGYQWNEEKNGFIVVKKNNLGALISYGLLVVSLVIGIVFGMNYLLNQTDIDPASAPYESKIKRAEEMSTSRILIPGYNDWNMIEGTNEIAVALFNPDKNPCYFQFNVILDETEELLYKTGLVPPGQAVTTVKLSRALEPGVHPITLKINSVSLDDKKQHYNGGEVKTNIVVLEE